MTTPINPSAIYPPGQNPNTNYGAWAAANPQLPAQPGPIGRTWNRIPQQSPVANPRFRYRAYNRQSAQLPMFLRNRSIVFNAWIIAMIVVGFDEWHNLGILPRPVRLWDTSLVYGVLIMLGFVDVMVPIANALAIGYTITLIWQYYNGNLTPAGSAGQALNNANQNAVNAAIAAGQPGGAFAVSTTPPTPGANFPINTQLTQ